MNERQHGRCLRKFIGKSAPHLQPTPLPNRIGGKNVFSNLEKFTIMFGQRRRAYDMPNGLDRFPITKLLDVFVQQFGGCRLCRTPGKASHDTRK